MSNTTNIFNAVKSIFSCRGAANNLLLDTSSQSSSEDSYLCESDCSHCCELDRKLKARELVGSLG